MWSTLEEKRRTVVDRNSYWSARLVGQGNTTFGVSGPFLKSKAFSGEVGVVKG